MLKAAINNGYDMDIKNAVEMEANLFGVVNDTNDKKEGMGAFLREESCKPYRFLIHFNFYLAGNF